MPFRYSFERSELVWYPVCRGNPASPGGGTPGAKRLVLGHHASGEARPPGDSRVWLGTTPVGEAAKRWGNHAAHGGGTPGAKRLYRGNRAPHGGAASTRPSGLGMRGHHASGVGTTGAQRLCIGYWGHRPLAGAKPCRWRHDCGSAPQVPRGFWRSARESGRASGCWSVRFWRDFDFQQLGNVANEWLAIA